jgi:hypothetical protein
LQGKFKYRIKSLKGIENLSLAIVDKALRDLPDSKSFFTSALYKEITSVIDVQPDKLQSTYKNLLPGYEPFWITNLEKRIQYNHLLPVSNN